ncbi:retention module-containing protein [Aquipseudomonas campi]|uniref:Retention module-containing protein n=1 Tax=Aquipseudomonas campi TaxID=2731681 RepID=A0A6M8FCG3_9GAMM|nr:retention module-containing protein [Pseudomonas campi]QKE63903.1 retention module-containing protein [Pseudomonas campi]
MATLIGVVSQVVGEVYAVAGDGTRRPLVEGDRVYAGEQLVTGASGAIAITMTNGQELTVGRDSSMALNEQMLAGAEGAPPASPEDAAPAAPSDSELTDVEQLQAAIEAGVDPTLEGEATAAGPGAGGGGAGGAGGVGGGHSFVLLGETGGALDPVIGFPTAGLNNGPEFPDAEPIVTPDPEAPDFTPDIDIEYQDESGTLIAGPAIVDEEGLADGTNPGSNAEQASGTIVINSPDGLSSLQVLDVNGNWIDVTNGGVVQGQYGILTVSAGGGWIYTLTDNTLDHGNPNATGAADQVGESFSVRMFDLDGDVSPTVQLDVLVNDDGPILTEGEGAQVAAIVDEDETSDGINDGDAVTNEASGGPGTLNALVNFGADGIGSFGLSGSPSAIGSMEAQGLSSGGTALTYSVVGNVLTASAGAETIFTLEVGADGSFNFILIGQLDHPNPDGNDDELLELPIDFSGVLAATDGDGDSVGTFNGGSFVIDVEDDVPQLASRSDGEEQFIPSVWDIVHEDALTTGAGAPHDGNPEGGQTTTASGPAGSLSALVNFGADGPGAFGLSSDIGSMDSQNLMSGGVLLTYVVVGNVLTASAGGETIFTLTVNGDGSWEFVLEGPIDHPIDDVTYDTEDLPGLGVDFSGILTATDGDGDPLVGGFPPNSFAIDIEDDVPVAVPLEYDERQQPTPLVSAQVDEDELPGGISDGDGEGTSANGVSGTLDAVVSFGADGPGSFGLSDSSAAIDSLEAQGLSSGGTPLTYTVVGNVLTAMAGLDPVFTLTINPDGGYTFELQGPLDHPLPGSTDDDQMLNLPIDFSGVLTASDGDGDTLNGFAPGTFVIAVEDDVPQALDDNATALAGEALNFNVAFVLDFSGSINNTELNTMLEAVRAAGQALFSGATGDVSIQIIAFSGDSASYPVVTDFATFSALIDSLNPADGGTRPFNGQTDFTDGIQETMAAYSPIPGWSNQVFFISDGNPNEQTGTGGNSLSDATAAAWNTFVDSNGINVTTIGVGDGINGPRLQDVDLDGNGAPILVDNFDELVDTLLDAVSGELVGGNVLLGDDNAVGGVGGDADDSFGADGPGQILSIDINGTLYTWDGVVDGGEQLTDIDTAEGGKLSFNFATGAWSYQAPGSVSGDQTETFTYTIVDNDGDPSTANLTVYVEDTRPVIDQVDEDELPDGNTDGDAVNTVATGSLADLIVGPPIAAQFSLSNDTSGLAPATSNGVGLVYSVSSNVLTATAGPAGPTVFTLQVDSNGDYTFTLLGPLDHPAGGNDDDDLLVMDFASILQASDGVDPVALAGGFLIQIEDDLPIIDTSPAPEDSLQVDETNLAADATTDFGAQFTELFGGDGPGTTTYALQISSSGTNTGLDDVATGFSIRLYMDGNDVVGKVGSFFGPIAFRVSLNSATGEVTLNQIRAIEHSPDSGPDQEASLAAANQIQLVGTIVDDDGDSNSAALDLGHAISFKDDAPSISGGAATVGTLRVDESNLGSNDTDDFSGFFSSSFGADGPGDIDYDLSISAVGADSGLKDTASGQDILLFMLGGDVVGRVGGPGGAIAFRVSVDGSGDVTLDQQRAIVHSPEAGPDQTAFLAAANLIKLTATITDEDGDSDSSTIDIGQSLAFEDDAPEIDGRTPSNDSLQVDETNLLVNDSTDFSGNFSDDYGADGPGTTVYSLDVSAAGANSGLDDTATGQDILLYNEGGMIVGRVGGPGGEVSFTVSVNPGSGVVTLDQQRAIFHTPNSGSNQESSLASANLIQLSATITDKDGDTDSDTINLGSAISFRDDGPNLNASAATNDSLQVDETFLLVDDTHDFSGNFTGSYGADGPGTLTYSLGVSSSGVNSGLDDTATGSDIRLYMDGNDVVGRVGNSGGPIAFRVSVDANGVVKLDQLRAIEHGSTNPDEEVSLGAASMVQLTATITDKDGDSDSETINLGSAISFKDDGPSVTSNAPMQLDDDALANGIPGGPGGTDDVESVLGGGILGHNFGADGAGTVKWLDSGAPGGFSYQASPDGSQLLVKQGATTVLTLTLNTASGAYTVTQNAPIQHANADLENNQPFTLNYQVTDKDGDKVDGTLSVNVDDDTPVAQDDVAYVATGQAEDINMVFVLDFSGSISDSELNLMLDAVRTAGQELFNSAGGAVQVQIVAFSDDSIGYPAVTDITAFTNLVNSLNPDEGGVRPLNSTTDFTDAIQQTMVSYVPLPGWNNQVVFISDGNPNEQTGPGGAPSLTEPTATNWNNFVDGNVITVTTIGIGDGINAPRLVDVDVDGGTNIPLQVGDFDDLVDTLLDNVVGGLVNGNVLHGSDGVNNGGSGDDDGYGADGPGRIMSIEIDGNTYTWDGVLDGDQILTGISTTHDGELDFNFATGAWTYHAPASGNGDQVETFDYVIIDKDGDPSEATLTVYVEDISPVIAKVDEDELSGGITDGDTETTIATGSVSNLVVGPSVGVQFSLSGSTGGLDGASSGGTPLVYSVLGDTLTAKAGVAGPTVFTLQVESDGDYTFTLLKPLDHAVGGNDDNALLVLDFASILQASDGVDPVPLAGQFLVQIEDDIPTVSANAPMQLDDDALANGIPGGPGGTDDVESVLGGGILGHNFGADGAGTVKWLDSGAPGGFSYQASPDGSQLLVKQGATTVLTLTLNTASGAYTVTQNAPIQHADADLENNQPFTLNYQVTDKDGDTANGSLSVNVDDDTPVAQDDVAYVATGQAEDINMVFVLDFSGSISNSELNLMLDAVRTAGQELFNNAGGAVQIQIVAFSDDSIGYPTATDITTFTNLVNSLNPDEGGVRPLNSTTDFTDAIQQTMVSYVPLSGWNNQVVFISDGNPNEQTGPGGAPSLTEPTATNWNNFVDGNVITVTTIGIGDGINAPRLVDVDVDGGTNIPLQVGDFDDLVDTLLDNVVGGLVNGNVLHGSDGVNNGGAGDDDGYGADGPGRILSIEINGITYVWNGAGVIDPSGVGPNIAGNQLTDIPTAEGGKLDFNFATGAWTYHAPASGNGDQVETFDYVIVDKDGDPSEATLTVYVEDISPVIAKVDEDELSGGITDGDTETTIATGSVSNLVVGPSVGVQFSLSGSTGGLDGASSGGTPLVYSVLGDTLTAKAGVAGPTVFTLQVESDGDYTFTLLKPLDHAVGGNDDNALLVLDFASILQASDGVDPVPLAGQFLVQIEDDIPTVSANAPMQLDDDALANGIPGGPGGTDDVESVLGGGILGHNFGADGAGTVKWLDSGAPGGFSYQASPDGSQLLVKQGATTVLTLTLNTASGAYTVTQNAPIQHANADLENNQPFTLNYQVTDKDGDTANGTLSVNVDDDSPMALDDSASVIESTGKDFNVAFVLDSSGSISDGEFTTMMNAVKAAGQALFAGTNGDVKVTIVAFSSDSQAYTPVTTLATFNAQVDSIIANRPFSGQTDFTDAIQQTMVSYSPTPGWENQVFFISDGNPNQQTGTGGNSLDDDVADDWADFLASGGGINVTTIGIGDGIDEERLEDVDLDANPVKDPLVVSEFDDLIDALLGQISGGDVSGNVLLGNDNAAGGVGVNADDAFGADGPGRILSIEINGITYVWNGAGVIDPSSGPNINSNQLSNISTAEGGKLSFNFQTGAWTYTAPASVNADVSETFNYTIIDKDGDPSDADLTVTVLDVNQAPSGTNATLNILEDGSKVFSAADFGFSDADGDSLMAVKITSVSGSGTLSYNGGAVPAEIAVGNLGLLVFTPVANGSGNGYASINFQVRDNGGTTNGGVDLDPTANTLTINVTPVNDAPVLNGAISPTMAAVAEDAPAPSGAVGTAVSSLVDFNPPAGGLNNVTDVDSGAVTGIALTGVDSSQGTWYYSTNSGSSWTAVGAVSDSSALLLSADGTDRLYFRPNANFNGSLPTAITYRAWDTTSGSAGIKVSTATNGGSTAFSSVLAIASLMVSAVNDAPTISSLNITETSIGFSIADVDSSSFSLVAPFAAAFGSPSLGLGSNSLTPTEQASPVAITTMQVWDGAATANVVNLYLGSSSGTSSGTGGSSTDAMYGFGGGDTLSGGSGNDFLYGGAGNDTLNGGDNNDQLTGGTGNDELNGGSGNDTYLFGLVDGVDTISDSADTDAIIINSSGSSLTGLSFLDSDTGSNGDLVIGINGQQITVVDHFDGDGEAVESITFSGGAQFGSYALSGLYNLVADGSGDRSGGAGNDILAGESDNESLSGGGGHDLLFGNGDNDSLVGGDGDDLLIGGTGSDTMRGGNTSGGGDSNGRDTFMWQSGNTGTDTINGFTINFDGNANGDRLDLSQLLTGEDDSAASLSSYLSFTFGVNTTITVDANAGGAGGTGQTIVLAGINLQTAYSAANASGVITAMLGDGTLEVDTV